MEAKFLKLKDDESLYASLALEVQARLEKQKCIGQEGRNLCVTHGKRDFAPPTQSLLLMLEDVFTLSHTLFAAVKEKMKSPIPDAATARFCVLFSSYVLDVKDMMEYTTELYETDLIKRSGTKIDSPTFASDLCEQQQTTPKQPKRKKCIFEERLYNLIRLLEEEDLYFDMSKADELFSEYEYSCFTLGQYEKDADNVCPNKKMEELADVFEKLAEKAAKLGNELYEGSETFVVTSKREIVLEDKMLLLDFLEQKLAQSLKIFSKLELSDKSKQEQLQREKLSIFYPVVVDTLKFHDENVVCKGKVNFLMYLKSKNLHFLGNVSAGNLLEYLENKANQ